LVIGFAEAKPQYQQYLKPRTVKSWLVMLVSTKRKDGDPPPGLQGRLPIFARDLLSY
jgi:hypothetical protein